MLAPIQGKNYRIVRSGLLIILLLFVYGSSNAAVYYSRTSGNWNSANSWSTVACGGAAAASFPGATDDVIICAGNTITVTANAEARTMEVSGTIITKDGITLTLEGNVTVQSTGALYLTGSASCNANEESTLIVKGNYTNFGISCFNKSWVIIAGDINSPSASGIQNNGYLVVGGNAAGIINQTGGQSVYAANPYATVTLTGTTPVLSPPTSPAGLVDIVNTIIYGGTCGFTINGPANVTSCSSGPVDFVIISTTAASPAYQWEVNSGFGWFPLDNAGIYSDVTTPVMHISDAAGLNAYIFRCKVTSGGCSKYSFAGTLTVSATPPPSAPVIGTITHPTCLSATGSVVISGLPAGSWTLNPGAITGNTPSTTITNLANGTYNFTVKNSIGCTSAASANVVINAPPATPSVPVAGTITQPTCASATGSVLLSGLPAGNWTIGPGSISGNTVTKTITGLATGTYTFTVTNESGCTSAATGNIVIAAQPTAPPAATFTIVQPTCTVSTGTITVTDPVGLYDFNIDGGSYQSSATFSNVVTGDHTILVRRTSDNTCISAAVTATVTAQPAIPASPTAGAITQPTCATSTGSVVLSGLPAGSWTINPGTITGSGITTTIAGLATGTHSFTVTNAAGCISAASSNIVIAGQPATPGAPAVGIITQPTCSTATGSVALSGLPSGNWTINPGGITGNTATTIISLLEAGTYNFTVTNSSGCISAESANVVINAQPATPTAPVVGTVTHATCGLSTGSVDLTGLPSGNWTINPGSIAGNTLTKTISGLAPGTYTFTVTNASGCNSSASAEVVINAAAGAPAAATFTIVQPTCAVSTGTITITGPVTGYEYNLDAGAYQASVTFGSVAPGSHTIRVRRASDNTCISAGATASIDAQPVTPAAPVAGAITQPTCASSTGSVVLSGLPAGNWTINPVGITGNTLTTTISGLDPGTHNFTVTNEAGCTSLSSGDVFLSSPPGAPAAPLVGTIIHATCASATGSVELSGLPPGTWTINPGAIAGNTVVTTISGLTAGTHNYTVTNSLGCISSASADVVINASAGAPASATFTLVQPTCSVTTGTITITGPLTGYEYSLDGGVYQSSVTFNNIASGDHTILVRRTSDNSCLSSSVTATIDPQPLTPVAPTVGTITQPNCALSTGSVVLSGLPAGDWTINPVGITGNTPTATIPGLTAGTHNFTVRNASGCTSAVSANVVINAAAGAPSAPVVGTITQPTCLLSTGSVDLSGLPAGNWTINPGGITGNTLTRTISGLSAGTYNFTVTNDAACISAASADVVINVQPVTPSAPVIGTITQPTCGTTTGSAVLSGLPSGDWTIEPGAITGNTATTTISGLAAGTHNFAVRNDAGCISGSSPAVIVAAAGAPAAATFTIVQPSCSVSTGTITISNPTGAYEYKLDAGAYQGTVTFNNVPSGDHTILVRRTTDNTCVSAPVTATVIAQPAIPLPPDVGTITQTTCASPAGSVVLTGLPSGDWTINPGGITGNTASRTITGLAAGTYNYTVTNASGCSSAATSDIVINAAAGAPASAILNIVQPTCTVPTGTITVSGPAGVYDYSIDGVFQGSTTFSNVPSGNHIILVRRSSDNTCISAPVTATVNAQPETPDAPVLGTITQTTCGSSLGSVVLTGLPVGSWTINPGALTGSTGSTTISNLVAGTHTFTVSNAAGCTSAASGNVVIALQPATPAAPIAGTITQPTCAVATGSVVLSGLPSGGWTINPGTITGNTTTTTISGLVSGTYNFTVTSASGCTSASTGNVVISAQPITPSSPNIGTISHPTCAIATGNVVLSGLPAGNWTINPGTITGNSATINVSGLSSGTYNFTVTNAAGCTSAATSSVVINAQPSTPAIPVVGTITQPTCALATGSVVLSGLPAGNWAINPGTITGNTATTTISGLAPGTYNYTVTSASGCFSAASANVVINAQPAPPAAATFTVIQPTCSLGGIITITAPTGAFEYNIDGGAYQSSTAFNNVTSGNHTILVRRTPDNTCVSSPVAVVVNVQPATPAAPVVGTITQPTCASSTGSVSLSGLPAGNWTINPGSVSDNTATTTISGLAAGTYNFTVTNDAGCTSVASGSVAINSQSLIAAPTVGTITQPTCATAAGSVVLSGLPAGNWTINPGGISGNTVTKTITDLAPGTYNFTVANDAGCVSAASGNVAINSQPEAPPSAIFTITQPTCALGTGTINITAPSGAYEYSIDGGAYQSSVSFGNVAPGNHTILVRRISDNTCVSVAVTAIINAPATAPAAPSVGTITQPSCTSATGSVAVSGLPSGNWTINPGAITGNTQATNITGLVPGTYTFTITDAGGCVSAPSDGVVIAASSSDLSMTVASKTNVLCKGGNTGTVTLAGAGGHGPYRYRMGSGQYQDSGIFGNLAVGDYVFTVIDANQCTSSVSANLSEPEALSFTYSSEEASCLTTPDGIATITPSGGTAPYMVLWPDGLSSANRNDLLPGTQKFIVTDANGCSSSFEIEITNKENPDCIQIQEIMTPNNDGFYDTWKIRNIGMYPEAEVQVFNRWGEKVFTTKNLQANEWDGTYNGKPLPTDSYHFILYLKKGMKPLTGTITIIR